MNLDKLRKHKDEAQRQLAKGRTKEALDELLAVNKLDPHDLANRQKVGDLWRKLGNNAEAIKGYQAVAGAYAADGLLLKSIAVCKIILQIDPNHTETQRILADLYGKKRGDAVPVEMPQAMSVAVSKPAPGQKMSASMIRGVPATSVQLRSEPRVPTGVPPPMPAAAIAPPPPMPVAASSDEPSLEIEIDTSAEISAEIDVEEVMEVEAAPPPARVITGIPLPPVVQGYPVAPQVPGPAASWGAAAQEPVPVVQAAGPGELEFMDMEGGAPPPAAREAGSEVSGAEEFADFLADDGAAPAHRVDVDKLPPIPLFSELSKNAFIDLLERMDVRPMTEGDIIVTEGETGDSFFIIASGQVRIEKTVEGKVIQLAQLGDGTFFGEIALLSGAPRTASVVAATDGELLEISRATLDAVIADYPSVAQVLQRFYKQRLLSNLLNTSKIFKAFDKEQRKSLIEMFRSRELAAGENILTEGQKGDGLYVLLSGRAKVIKTLPGGPKELATLKEGDVFGEMSLLTRDPVSATIVAVGKAMVLRLPRKQFNEVIMTHPQVLEMVSEVSAQRQRNNV